MGFPKLSKLLFPQQEISSHFNWGLSSSTESAGVFYTNFYIYFTEW